MPDNTASWDDIGDFIQDAARQMREFGLTTLDVEHGGSRVRIKIKAARTARSEPSGTQVLVEQMPAPIQHAQPNTHVVSSPMIGTFYASSNPGEPPFVQEGDEVEVGQVVGIIEAMKIMNEIAADVAGVIDRVLIRNAQAVEYGQPLFEITPNN